jgi:RsiW-degrading membrane proteinase PrsW (M82 family)
MTGQSANSAGLRQISQIAGVSRSLFYPLSQNQVIVIGRDPSTCQIVLDSQSYQGVSRRHVEIRPLTTSTSPQWQICDLDSANGTFVNQKRLQGCQPLHNGDRILLGKNGAEFVFEFQANNFVPSGNSFLPQNQDSLRLTQLIPIISTKQDLLKKAYLIPGLLTVLCVVGLFISIGNPQMFNALLGFYLAGAGYFFIYQLSGKQKPWWVLVASALMTMIILVSPILSLFIFVFRDILPGNIEETNFLSAFVGHFFGAGLMEELLKAIPVFTAFWIGRALKSPWRERIGVWEPLDGILLGSASAVGFTLLETLGQYVPLQVQNAASQFGAGVGELVGIQLLIPRIIGSVAGHMSYSGYFGYFIGLSILKPSKRWSILTIGYLSSSILHALWNASGNLHPIVLAFSGMLAYVFLVAAILKARQLSPTRSQNFATRFHPPQ